MTPDDAAAFRRRMDTLIGALVLLSTVTFVGALALWVLVYLFVSHTGGFPF